MKHTANRITRTVAVAVAGVAVGLGTTFAVANGGSSEQRLDFPDERAAIAEWAIGHHLSGLSPASLASSPDTDDEWTPQLVAEMKAIADYAREHGLSGLSPASLQPIGD